jgi:PmbA protein
MNFYIKPSESSSADGLVKSLSKGIVVLGAMGVHTANPVSGDFSIGISGLWIENGEVVYPVKEAIISGNVLELFSKVEAVGDDLKFYGSTGSPSLLIGNMDISA